MERISLVIEDSFVSILLKCCMFIMENLNLDDKRNIKVTCNLVVGVEPGGSQNFKRGKPFSVVGGG